MKRNNPFVPLEKEESHGSERLKAGNAAAKGETHDSKKAGREGQVGEQKRGSSKNSPGRSNQSISRN
jgi:hypothetical protein